MLLNIGRTGNTGVQNINLIGTPGAQGFGVGVCPINKVPSGMAGMAGYTELGNDNYGNYQFQDGSVMCWIPKFYYKVGTGSNELDVNVIDIKGIDTYPTTAAANADGYALHRVFIDGGSEKDGFFVDKYMCSKNAWGTGHIASSIANGLPISMHANHNPVADLSACSGNYYYEAINAAHARDGENGVVNPASIFFVKSQFIQSMLAILSIAHGQVAVSDTYCAWYDATGTTNYPKGCNDNALGDVDDAEISYVSDGYSDCGKTGSGSPFAKTTHNGQNCGVADLNGLMWETSIGATCIATSKSITGATQANPCQLTLTGHERSTGDYVQITSVGGMTQINNKLFKITVVDVDHFALDGVDSTGFGVYTSGGTATFGDFYVAKEATAMKDFTPGNSSPSDHWGTTGIAAMMEEFTMPFETVYPNNGFAQRIGSEANQVLSEAVTGNGRVLTSLNLPKDKDGVDTSGTNLFGKDYFYQYIQNELCVLSCGSWNLSSLAGVFYSSWHNYRTYSHSGVGFRLACYPV